MPQQLTIVAATIRQTDIEMHPLVKIEITAPVHGPANG
jgi:hypothetical protein